MPKFLATAIVAVLVSLVLGPVPAYAHAALVSTDPGDGARLDAAPTEVTLEFSENVGTPAFVAITAPNGVQVKTSAVKAIDKTVSATVAPVDLKGSYTMSYRVVSSDGHPIKGQTTFEVTTGRTAVQLPAAPTESFAHRHKSHLWWGFLGALVAVGLLLWPLRGTRD